MTSRPSIIGPDAGPEPPYPYRMEGPVINGFGRGSKELGIPTANLPVDEKVTPWITDRPSGVYFGWAVLSTKEKKEEEKKEDKEDKEKGDLYPMVMSIGYNPFYHNTTRTAEVHLLHKFSEDFYGAHLRLAVLGYIRPEQNYDSLEALVADIQFDCVVAKNSLARAAWTPAGVAVDQAKEGEKGHFRVRGCLRSG